MDMLLLFPLSGIAANPPPLLLQEPLPHPQTLVEAKQGGSAVTQG